MKVIRSFCVCVLTLVIFVNESEAVNVAKDLTLTSKQKAALDIFKKNVGPKLTKDYQKSDIYLIRWLRAKNFDLKQAEDMLMQDARWRQQNAMDAIRGEDWSEFEKDYPYQVDGYDNEGKPIMSANFDEWDLRKGVLSGQRDKLMRYMAGAMDRATNRVRELQAEGKNVTQWDFIINMNNFNLVQHGCIQCLPIYVAFVANYENHFPGSADKIMLINTPAIFEVVLSLIRPIMSTQTREALKVYNNNKAEWEPIVFKDIKRDQLPKTYGGTKEANY